MKKRKFKVGDRIIVLENDENSQEGPGIITKVLKGSKYEVYDYDYTTFSPDAIDTDGWGLMEKDAILDNKYLNFETVKDFLELDD